MRIIITDTNVFIDLIKSEALDLYTIITNLAFAI